MRSFILLCTLFFTGFFTGACHHHFDEAGSTDPAPADPAPAAPGTATLRLIVRDADGLIVENADVNVDGVPQGEVSDAEGRCEFTVPTGTQLIVRARKQGFVEQVRPLDVARDADSFWLSLTLIRRADKLVLADGGELIGEAGAKISIPSNAFVDRAGNPITGAVDAYLTPVDVSDAEAKRAFPGRYDGIDAGGTDTPILSLGCVDFTFEQNGMDLDLAPGAKATIEIPIFVLKDADGNDIAAGQKVPLWSLDEINGGWTQEGVGTVVASADSRSGWALRGDVGHFSWWNADYPRGPTTFLIDVSIEQNGQRVPAPKGTTVLLEAETLGDGPTSLATTIWRVGESEPLRIPSDVDLAVRAAIGDQFRGETTVRVEPNGEREVVIVLTPLYNNGYQFRPGDRLRGCHDKVGDVHVFEFVSDANRTIRLRAYPVDTLVDAPELTGGLGGRVVVKDDSGTQIAEALFDASGIGIVNLDLPRAGKYSVELIADGKVPGCYVVTTRLELTQKSPDTGTVYVFGRVLDPSRMEVFRAPLTGAFPATEPTRVSASNLPNIIYGFDVSADQKFTVYESDPNRRTSPELFVVKQSNPGSAVRAHESFDFDKRRLLDWGLSDAFPDTLVFALRDGVSGGDLLMVDLDNPGTTVTLQDNSIDTTLGAKEFRFADDGRKVVYRGIQDNSADKTKPDSFLYVVDLTDPGNATRLSPLALAGTGVDKFWVSPDGQSVVFTQVRRDEQTLQSFRDLYRVELSNPGVATRISDPAQTENVEEAVFSPNGEHVVFLDKSHLWLPDSQNAGKVVRLSVVNGGVISASNVKEPAPFESNWQISADNRWLVFRRTLLSGRGRIDRVDLDNPGTATMLYDGTALFGITPDSAGIIVAFSEDNDLGVLYTALGLVRFNDTSTVIRLTEPITQDRRGVTLGQKDSFAFGPNGDRIYYLTDREVKKRYDLMVLDLAVPLLPTRIFDDFPTGDSGVTFKFQLVR